MQVGKGEAAASAPETDGLSPPSAARCRCPRPKRGDGFALCRIVRLCAKVCVVVACVCSLSAEGRAWKGQRQIDQCKSWPDGSRPCTCSSQLRQRPGTWSWQAEAGSRAGLGERESLQLSPRRKSIAAIPLGAS